jgi:hypothetical protein
MSTKRKGISKKVRFEVFKRDSFKCVYCGRSAPEVILHIDHVQPHSKGGADDIFNYVTACESCNQGKGARQLDDNSIVMRQKAELDKLNERKEQLEMLIQWRNELSSINNKELEYFETILNDKFHKILTEYGKKNVGGLIKKYGLSLVLDKLDVIYQKSVDNDIINELEKYLRVAVAEQDKPYLKDMFYIRKILENKFELSKRERWEVLKLIEYNIKNDVGIEWLKNSAIKCSSFWQFKCWLGEE